jgi:hypothetical protein
VADPPSDPRSGGGEGGSTPGDLVGAVRAVMDSHWRPDLGFTTPNATVYPWLWSWDSCFHALIWEALGRPDRAVRELEAVFAAQTAAGFVPHMTYGADPGRSEELWGRRGASTITQPPMYGHAIAVLHRHGHAVDHLLAPASRALRHLLEERRAPCGLVRILHPWESGIDDHPRFAAWQPDPWDREAWASIKVELVRDLLVVEGEAVASASFDVCPAGFNALVAWNGMQLASVTGDEALFAAAEDVSIALDQTWDGRRLTWCDADPTGRPGSGVDTIDALLTALVTADAGRAEVAIAAAVDPQRFGSPFGPAGVATDEGAYAPDGYGRGATWPHLTYLLWVAALASGLVGEAAALGRLLVAGASRSGLAEYWDPRDGTGYGARPQSWTGLAAVVADSL